MTALLFAWLLAIAGVAVSDAPSAVTVPLLVGGLLITMSPLLASDIVGAFLNRKLRLPDRVWLAAAAVAVSIVPVWGAWQSLSHEQIRIGAIPAVLLLALGLVVTWLVHRHADPSRRIPFLFAVAQLTAFFITAHLAEETLLAVREGTELLRLGMFFGGWAASILFALGSMFRIVDATPVQPSEAVGSRKLRVFEGALRIAAGAAGVALLVADRNLFLGLYEPLHNWMLFLGIAGVLVPMTWVLASLARRVKAPPAFATLPVVLGGGFVLWLLVSPTATDPFVRSAIDSARTAELALRFREATELGKGLESDDVELLDFETHHDFEHDLPKYNIVLISVDTLRADWVGPDARNGGHTPRLDELIAEAAWFPRAYAPGNRTAISMSGLLIGRYSANLEWNLWYWHRGRVHDPATTSDETRKKWGKDWGYTTIPTFPENGTVARRMQKAGYYTMGAPYARNAAFFRVGIGFEQGFDEYRDLSKSIRGKPTTSRVMVQALEQLDAAPADRPWFQWIHLFDPHESRATPKTYAPMVEATDKGIGEFIDGLQKRGVWDETVLIVVADHGEAMKEHGYTYHGHSMYDEQVNVPMIIRVPGMPPRVLNEPTSIIDAVPTLLSIARADMRELDGVNLLPFLQTGNYAPGRPVFVEMHRYQGKSGDPNQNAKAIVVDNWKLIYERRKEWVKLFDLAADPKELKDVAIDNPIVARRLLQALVSWINPRERARPLPNIEPPSPPTR